MRSSRKWVNVLLVVASASMLMTWGCGWNLAGKAFEGGLFGTAGGVVTLGVAGALLWQTAIVPALNAIGVNP